MLQLFRAQLHLCFPLSVFPSVCKIEHTGNFLFPYLSLFAFFACQRNLSRSWSTFFPGKTVLFSKFSNFMEGAPISDFRKKLGFCPYYKGGRGVVYNPNIL